MSTTDQNINVNERKKFQDGRLEQESNYTQETAGQDTEVNPGTSKGCQGTRSRTQVKTSYLRPNRDYSNQINWSYELNKDTYEVYKAAELSKRGYMQRMKEEWDKMHPK